MQSIGVHDGGVKTWQQVAGTTAERSHLDLKGRVNEAHWERWESFATPKPASDAPPTTRPNILVLPKQLHQWRTEYLSI